MKYRILEKYSSEDEKPMFYPQFQKWYSWRNFDGPSKVAGHIGDAKFPTKEEANKFLDMRIPKVHEYPHVEYSNHRCLGRRIPKFPPVVKPEPPEGFLSEGK